MKITFITGHLCKERHVLFNELILDLGKYGAEVTVLTGYPSRGITEEVRQYYIQHPIEKVSDNVTVYRIGSKKGEGKGLLSRMVKYVFLTRKLYKAAKKTDTDVFYIYSAPPFLGYMGCKLAKKVPTLYNAQDLFPDTLIHMKNINEKNTLIKYLRHKEKQVYQKNTKIVTISEEMKNTIASSGCPEDKIEVIYNWADTENLHHVDKSDNKLMDELGIDKNRFIVSYAGDIGLFQGWNVILDAAKILQDKNPDILFSIIGSGSFKEELENRILNEKIDNIQIFPLQSVNRLSEVYSVGDMELMPIVKGITKTSLPSKMSVIMASGSAVLGIADANSDIEHIIKNQNVGIIVEPGSVDKLVNAIQYCYDNKEKIPEWGKNARAFAVENYSRKKQTKKYFEQLESIIKN